MTEYGECIFIETKTDELTREMVDEAGPLVEASFRYWQGHGDLAKAELTTYRFVAGAPIQVGEEKWHHPFGWYCQVEDQIRQRRIRR